MLYGEGLYKMRYDKIVIDSNQGYIKDNIGIISHRANTLKSNGNLKQFQNIILYMIGE